MHLNGTEPSAHSWACCTPGKWAQSSGRVLIGDGLRVVTTTGREKSTNGSAFAGRRGWKNCRRLDEVVRIADVVDVRRAAFRRRADGPRPTRPGARPHRPAGCTWTPTRFRRPRRLRSGECWRVRAWITWMRRSTAWLRGCRRRRRLPERPAHRRGRPAVRADPAGAGGRRRAGQSVGPEGRAGGAVEGHDGAVPGDRRQWPAKRASARSSWSAAGRTTPA